MAMPFEWVSEFGERRSFSPVGGGGGVPTMAEVVADVSQDDVYLFCLLFYDSRATMLDRDLAAFVEARHRMLDDLFGRGLLGLAIPKTDRDRDTQSGGIYEYARMYGVEAEEMPCALFSTDLDQGRSLKLPFEAFLPPKRSNDDLARCFEMIAGAAHRTAKVPDKRRIKSFHRSLRDSRRRTYGKRVTPERRVLTQVAANSEALAQIAKNGRTILAVAASSAGFFLGGPAVASAPGEPVNTQFQTPAQVLIDNPQEGRPRHLSDSAKAPRPN